MKINDKEIRVVPLEEELQQQKGKGGRAPAKKEPAKSKPASMAAKGNAKVEDTVKIVEQYKERNLLVLTGISVFFIFNLGFIVLLLYKLAVEQDIDKILQVYAMLSVPINGVFTSFIGYHFGKQSNRNNER